MASGNVLTCSPYRLGQLSGRRLSVLIVSVSGGGPNGGSGCQYFPGEFDGERFQIDSTYPTPTPAYVRQGRLLADFEGDHYGAWTVSGTAFGAGPARGTWEHQQPVSGFLKRGLVNRYRGRNAVAGSVAFTAFRNHSGLP
ncbi:MAG: hypothetical protein RMN51_09865 [Verrucomicrobiota bacterium]|nr:hypothetical protein [Limisphaera sp.]MDW8382395.1 hypothetical protein [Verrucomicrobiota bacterium]